MREKDKIFISFPVHLKSLSLSLSHSLSLFPSPQCCLKRIPSGEIVFSVVQVIHNLAGLSHATAYFRAVVCPLVQYNQERACPVLLI